MQLWVPMSKYSEFFFNSSSNVVNIETFEISHPSFSKTYWIVRNAMNGITANLEDGTSQTFDYYPLQVKRTGASDDLDQKLEVQLGDLGMVIPQEIARCHAAGTMSTKPTLKYRAYRSDDLNSPMDGPFRFEVTTVPRKRAASALQAGAPRLNSNRTGETYTMLRFPMLRAFL